MCWPTHITAMYNLTSDSTTHWELLNIKQLLEIHNMHCNISIDAQSTSLPKLVISSCSKTMYMNKNKCFLLNIFAAKISKNFSKIVYNGCLRKHIELAFKNIMGKTRKAYVPIIHFNNKPIKLKSKRNNLLLMYSKDSRKKLTCEIHWHKQRQGLQSCRKPPAHKQLHKHVHFFSATAIILFNRR